MSNNRLATDWSYYADVEAGDGEQAAEQARLEIHTIGDLIHSHPHLRPPVLYGLLRQGETMNVISNPKVGKSWLVADLALAIVTGRQWLGLYDVEPGKVLIVDNELHRETLAHRIPRVADAREIPPTDYSADLHVVTLRGRLADIIGLGPQLLDHIEPGAYRLIILDALYRAVPVGADENSNSAIAGVYNHIDAYAMRLDCGFCCVHHATKGSQAGKDVTDVGAGAGSQSRATDTHLILRPHEEPDAVVLEAAARSWPPIDPVVLRWDWPLWTPDTQLDPALLKQPQPKRQMGATVDDVLDAILAAFIHYPNGATKQDIREYVGQPRAFGKAWLHATTGGDVISCEVKKGSRVWPGFKRIYHDDADI